MVRYPVGDVRREKYFTNKTSAKVWAKRKEIEIHHDGLSATQITSEEKRALADYRERLRHHGRTLRDALEHCCDVLDRTGTKPCLIHELRDHLIRRRKSEGKSPRHVADLESCLGAFVEKFGDNQVASVSTEEVDTWLTELNLAPVTVTNYRRILHNLFNEGIRKKFISSNPVAHAIKPKLTENKIGILTVHQAHALLKHVATDALAATGIGLFAGLRRSEIERLDWSDIDLEESYIDVPATKTKSARRRLVKIQPCLRALLKSLAQDQAPIIASTWIYRSRLEEAIAAAGIGTWPANALRHSFASYHLAHFNDAAHLALELGHTDTRVISQHYRKLVKPRDAAEFWAYRPGKGT